MLNLKKLNNNLVLIGLIVTLSLVIVGVFFFSYSMETLDLKAGELGLEEQSIYEPPFPDYKIVGFENKWSNLIISLTSTLLLFVVTFAVAKLLSKKKR